jgi:hypothetical protein
LVQTLTVWMPIEASAFESNPDHKRASWSHPGWPLVQTLTVWMPIIQTLTVWMPFEASAFESNPDHK